MATEGVTVANAFVQVMPSMEGAGTNITNALLPQLSSSGEMAGASFGNAFAGKAGAVMKVAGGAIAGAFAVDALADAYGEVEAGLNNLKIATGATGEAAKELEGVYLEVSKNVAGSFEDIGSAVGELNTRLDLQGDELEAASEQAMKYAKVTGQDATAAIQDVSRMMNNAGISADEYSKVLDMLTVAAQKSGVDVSTLTTTVNDNAASFKELGFSTEESIAMLASFEKSGANTSQILAGMKKGVAAWAKEGKSAQQGFKEFVDGVAEGSLTAQDAIDIFGSRAGVAMFDAAQKGQLSFEDMYDAITNGSENALNDVYYDTLTASEKFDILGKNFQAGFFEIVEPIVDAITPYIDDIIEGVKNAIDTIVPIVVEGSTWIAENVIPVLSNMYDWFTANILPSLENLAQVVVNDVIPTVFELAENISPFLENAIENTTAALAPAIDAISFFVGLLNDAIRAVKDLDEQLHILAPTLNVLSSVIPGGNVFLQSPTNGVVAQYASGGYVDSPTFAVVGEGGYGEYMVPGNYIGQLAAEIGKYGTGGDTNIYVNVEAREDDPYELARTLGEAIAVELRSQGVCA